MKVAIIAIDEGALFELGCAVELFGLPRPEYEDWYECDVVTFADRCLSYTASVGVVARKIRSLQSYDMLIIPSWNYEKDEIEPKLKSEILKFYRQGKRIVSFCSGAFLLGYLGILDNREATTHWRYAEKFRSLFPDTDYIENVLYVYDGKVGCSAGSAAGLDLGIEIIKEDYGYKVANEVSRRLVLPAHRNGGQAQFVETPVLKAPGKFADALNWAIENLHSITSIEAISDRARMSRRTFDRKFRSTFGRGPNDWLIDQRLELTKSLLEDSENTIEEVSDAAGFGSAITMRHHFRTRYGVTPTQFRRQLKSSTPVKVL